MVISFEGGATRPFCFRSPERFSVGVWWKCAAGEGGFFRFLKSEAEKLSRRVPRRLNEFFHLRRSFLDRKTHRFRAIHRVVGVNTALRSHGFQETPHSVY